VTAIAPLSGSRDQYGKGGVDYIIVPDDLHPLRLSDEASGEPQRQERDQTGDIQDSGTPVNAPENVHRVKVEKFVCIITSRVPANRMPIAQKNRAWKVRRPVPHLFCPNTSANRLDRSRSDQNG
jgi:hypothetical protein